MPRLDPDEGPDPDIDASLLDDDEDGVLVRCPSCGEKVYHDVDQCPACGEWITDAGRAKSSGRSLWMAVLIALLVLAMMRWMM